MNTLRKSQLNEQFIRELVGNSFFTIEFIKKDSTLRKLNGRLGVTKHLRGGQDSTSHIDKYLNVFENGSETKYRKVNLETTQKIVVGKQTYIVGE